MEFLNETMYCSVYVVCSPVMNRLKMTNRLVFFASGARKLGFNINH